MGNLTDLGNTGLTALAGGGQTGATALIEGINIITTVATAADSVMLPPARAGLVVRVVNLGANPLQIFGSAATSDTINSIATATGISQGVNEIVDYVCNTGIAPINPSSTPTKYSAGNWQVSQGGSGKVAVVALSASAPAINPHESATYAFTRAGVVAATLAAPISGTDDGVTITFFSTTTDQDTVTSTGNFNSGAAAVNLATWPAHAGGTLTIRAYLGKWNIMSNNLVVMS